MSVTIHGSDEFKDPQGFFLPEKIESFDMLRTISEYGRGELKKLCGPDQWSKLRVSRLGVDPDQYSARPFRWNSSPFELMSVGRLVALKGLHVLIAALDRLVRQHRAVRLRIAGDGPERPRLEREVESRGLAKYVTFEGWLDPDRIRDVYQQTDIFVLPSLAEGIPVVLMEAMAMEIPCVATAITGIPELIRHGVDGLLVQASSEEELAGALTRLLDDPEYRLRLGKAARRRVLEDFDLARNTSVFAQMLRETHGGAEQSGC
jgi:glycosyltransferase involved in cell wall biosynthesis